MPVYEYECGSCGGRFEAVRKFSDPDLSVCQLCNASNVRKVLSTPAFVLKGAAGMRRIIRRTTEKREMLQKNPKRSQSRQPAVPRVTARARVLPKAEP